MTDVSSFNPLQGAVKIIFRDGQEAAEREREYVDKFANPFPAATRGRFLVFIW